MSTDTVTSTSQQCLKRLLDEPADHAAKCKQARRVPHPPSAGLAACPGPRVSAPKSSQDQSPPRVGQYVLLERYEGEEAYRAEHSQTKKQFTCQVRAAQK